MASPLPALNWPTLPYSDPRLSHPPEDAFLIDRLDVVTLRVCVYACADAYLVDVSGCCAGVAAELAEARAAGRGKREREGALHYFGPLSFV